MGSNEGNDNEYPQRRVYLDAYRIDKYPVSNNEYSGPKTQEYKPPFSKGRHPTVGISWFQAMKFCRSRGKRLPTEAEWEKAARGAKGNKYPWGNRWDPSRLVWAKNSGDQTHPVDRKTLNHTSPYGVVDMMGNVMEWVADWYQEDYYKKGPDKNPKGPKKGKMRVIRGGSWYTDDPWDLDAADRQRVVPDFWDDDIGFRCAKNAR
jgi:formylglycine-generating enzyme required for sulfatase activity